jgi:hypothetical protein
MDWARRTVFALSLSLIGGLAGLSLAAPAYAEFSQVQQPSGTASKQIGTIKAIGGSAITLTSDSGIEVNVLVDDSTRMVRIEPGQKDLKGAMPVQLQDLQAGDRILVRGTTSEEGRSVIASSIILMKRTDIEHKQSKEQEDWQKRGVGGLVKSLDASGGTITIAGSVGAAARTITIRISKDTILRRYAPDSVKFSDARPGTLNGIKPGDQLRARGSRSREGGEFMAEEIVTGSFRNIAGTIVSIDAGASQLSVTDLLTKKLVIVRVTKDSQMRKLPPRIAQTIATRLKGSPSAATPGANPGPGSRPQRTREDEGGSRLGGSGKEPAEEATDLQQMLSQLPPATMAELQKGDAVMIVSTEGSASGEVTAITLLSGVEPILTAAPESQATLLSGWGLNAPSGGGEGGTP